VNKTRALKNGKEDRKSKPNKRLAATVGRAGEAPIWQTKRTQDVIGVRRRVSKGVEDGRRPPSLQAGYP
jgi:hypothetical protein